jgi:hypothetical protein
MVKKFLKDIFGDIRTYCVTVLLTGLGSCSKTVKQQARQFYQWTTSTETRAWHTSEILFLAAVLCILVAYLLWLKRPPEITEPPKPKEPTKPPSGAFSSANQLTGGKNKDGIEFERITGDGKDFFG